MPCFSPRSGFRAAKPNPTGKYSIVYSRRQANAALTTENACGQCSGCRLEQSRQYAVRVLLEMNCYDSPGSFITLTYDDDHLPAYGNLDYSHPTKFVQAVRDKYGAGIRTFGCAEYGERSGRAHYHIIFLNFQFPDLVEVESSRSGGRQFESQSLTGLWGRGRALSSEVNFDTAAYVARYALKKMSAPASHHMYMDEHGEIFERPGAKSVCVSRMPGIGKPFIDKYGFGEVYNTDSVVADGKSIPPPKYFDRLLEKFHPEWYERVKRSRFKRFHKCCGFRFCLHSYHVEDNRTTRLFTRSEVARLRFEFFTEGKKSL